MPRTKKQHLKRRSDGRYLCRYQGLCFYGKTEDEAIKARDEYKKGQRYAHPELFSEYAANWLNVYKGHTARGTYNDCVRAINKFIDEIGDKPMHRYTQTDIVRFFNLFVGRSASTIAKYRDTINAVFRAAYADGVIAREPTINAKAPKGRKGTHRAITPEERLLIHQLQHRFRPAVMTMLYAGLRRGEVCALDVQRDIDFSRKTLTVRQAIRYDSNRGAVCSPKTEAGTRTVPLLDILADELRGIDGLVCKSATGKQMTACAFLSALASYNHALNKLRKTPGIDIRAHDLRHSFCTMLYDAGVDIKSAMLWMGHTDQQTTMRIYTHLSDTRREEAEKALRNAEKMLISRQNARQDLLTIPETVEK